MDKWLAVKAARHPRFFFRGGVPKDDVLNTLVVHGAVSLDHLAWGIHGDPQRAREMAHLGGKYWTNQRTSACDRRHELAASLARKVAYRI
jgi:hypothetical protein